MVLTPRLQAPAALAPRTPSPPERARIVCGSREGEMRPSKMSREALFALEYVDMTGQCGRSGSSAPPRAMQSLSLRQLRYHTRNVLQCVLIDIHEHAANWRTPRDRYLLEQLADRIQRSVAIADTLFGVTSEPSPFPERLRTLCHGMLTLFADPTQHLRLDISVEGTCPPELEMPALGATHELIGNAVKDGMRMRLQGRVTVSLTCSIDKVMLVVADDGWELTHLDNTGEGLGLTRDLVDQFCGTLSVERRKDNTVATIMLRTMK
jgi:two-component sensor histidine kinase